MHPHRWKEIEAIFHEVADLAPEQRAAVLQARCSGDGALRAEVESLLDASDATGVIDAAVQGEALMVSDAVAPLAPGASLGPYRLIRPLGHGGMGEVFLAMRDDDEYQKQVAIKLVKGGFATGATLRRFRGERQILANLDHPNIARLLDGGTTETGVPYVVMEYIAGEPIDAYCDRQKLTVDERLRLFRKVCAAVQYAHQNLVVHRDLKPGNILVTAGGEPKLLDFGIAKLLDAGQDLPEAAETRTHMRLMTPDYASPEQVLGKPITTTSDIYSLGVVLYELLAGERPYALQEYTAGEIERAVCLQDPAKPSTALSRAAATVGPDRQSTTEKLRRRLRGDLDNIVLMALRKEPDRRYASVEQLSEDIRRHLEGLPVQARQDTVGYRSQKFLRRNKAAVATAAAVLMLVTALVGFYTARLADERDRARAEAAKAEQVSEFLTQLFQGSDPDQAKGEVVTAKELLDRGAAKIEQDLGTQPEVQATMMNVMGKVYERLGLYEQAGTLFRRALDIRRKLHGEGTAEVAESLNNMGELLNKSDDFAAAEPLLRRALAIRQKLFGSEHRTVAESMSNLGTLLRAQGGHDDAAESYYRQALAISSKLLGPDHTDVAETMNDLAIILQDKGEYDEAESLLRQLLERDRRVLGGEHPRSTDSLNNLAMLLQEKGDYAGAEQYFRRVVGLDRKMLGNQHPALVTSLANLASLLGDEGKHEEAESLLREAIALLRTLKGEAHWRVAFYEARLAKVLHAKGDYGAAEALYTQSLAVFRKELPGDNKYAAAPLFGLGRLLADRGRSAEAEPLLRRSLDIWRATLPPTHQLIPEVENTLGGCLVALGRYEEAEPLLVGSYGNLRKRFGERDRRTQESLHRVIALYEAIKQPEKIAQYRAVLEKVEPVGTAAN